MAELSVNEQILIELKRQNALLEEQLRPQREAERRRELLRQEQEDKCKLESGLNCSRRIIAKRYFEILGKHESLKTLSNQNCPIDTRNYMGYAGITPHQHEEIRKWREKAASEKLKLEEELRQLQESEAKHLTELSKFYTPDVYDRYIKRFIDYELRQRSHQQIADDLKRPYSFRVRL